jgi:hypothetical protein
MAQISQLMSQAEADAARVLRGSGAGAGALAGPGGAVAGPGGLAAAVGAAAGAAVGAALAGGLGAAAGAAIGAGVAAGVAAGIQHAQEDAAVDRMLTKFTPKVRELVKQSPTLRAEVLKLENDGYSFKTGAVADGYYTDWTGKQIVIDQPLGDAVTVSHIAHEVGHGVSSQQQSIPATPTTTKAQYVQANVDNLMHNEGEAQFNATKVRDELKASGGPDTGIPGTQTAAYQKVYDDFKAGSLTQAQAIDKMGTLMGNEHVSTPPYQAYRDSYGDFYKADWDKNIAPTRTP